MKKTRKTQPRKAANSSEHALTCPLPPSISYELLETLRLEVVKYLNWVTHELVQTEPQQALREIQRAADRLTRITAMIPDAIQRHMQEYEKQIEIQRLSTGSVDRSLEARIKAAREDDTPADNEDISSEDIPF